MKKKIKLITAVITIISLVLPCYALPTGDISNDYVPKEEFNSVFANFNERLSKFEAGINAKIDQQVSSYLDRYGIWNGEEQQIIASAKFVYFGEDEYKNRYICYNNPPTTFSTKPEAVFKTNIIESGDFMVPTKSGLLCLDVDTTSGYSTSSHIWTVDNRRTFHYQQSTYYSVDQSSSKGFYYAMELYDYNTNDLKMAIDIGEPFNVGNTTSGWNTSGFMVIYKNFAGLYQCFVEKDKPIKWRTILKYNICGSATSSFTFNEQMTNEWNLRFKKAIVY